MYYSVESCEFKMESPIKQTLDSGCISYCNNIHATNCNENSRRYRLDTTVAVLLGISHTAVSRCIFMVTSLAISKHTLPTAAHGDVLYFIVLYCFTVLYSTLFPSGVSHTTFLILLNTLQYSYGANDFIQYFTCTHGHNIM